MGDQKPLYQLEWPNVRNVLINELDSYIHTYLLKGSFYIVTAAIVCITTNDHHPRITAAMHKIIIHVHTMIRHCHI